MCNCRAIARPLITQRRNGTKDENPALIPSLLPLSGLIVCTPFPVTKGIRTCPSRSSGFGKWADSADSVENKVLSPPRIQALRYGPAALLSLFCPSTRQTPPSSRCPVHWGTGTCSLLKKGNRVFTGPGTAKYRLKWIRPYPLRGYCSCQHN